MIRLSKPPCLLTACLLVSTIATTWGEELPLTGPAYRLADQAYQAYARRDYRTAVRYASEAVRQRPDVVRLRLLLRNAEAAVMSSQSAKKVRKLSTAPQIESPLQAKLTEIIRLQHAGQLDAALQLADATIASEGPNDAVSAQSNLLRHQLALEAANRAYAALSRQAWADAASAAQTAIDGAPDEMSYRLLLIYALLRNGQNATAEAAATHAIEMDDHDVSPLLMRACARQAQGHRAAAQNDYALAGKLPLAAVASRYRALIVADSALAAGDGTTAAAALQTIDVDDMDVAERRKLAELQIANPSDVALRPTLVPPALSCHAVDNATICNARPGGDPAYSLATAANQAMSVRQYAEAVARAKVLVAIAPDNDNYLLLLVGALAANGELEESRSYARIALASPSAEKRSSVERAYLALAADDTATAHAAFQQADAAGQLPAKSLQDAAYTAQRAKAPLDAGHYFRKAIDASDAGTLDIAPQALFDTRRAVAEEERRGGVYVSLSYRGAGDLVGAPGFEQQADSLNWGSEAFWRPLVLTGNGTYVDFYGSVFESFYSKAGYATGAASLQGAVGARWKPLIAHDLTLAFERLIRLGDASTQDWLAWLGYSAGQGTDLRVDVPSWWTMDVNAEVGRYVDAGVSYETSEWRAGRSYRVQALDIGNAKTVVWPHAVVGIDYSTAFSSRKAIGAGIGVNMRYWFRENFYTAPQSYFDLSLQYRVKLSGDDRAGGVFLRGNLYY